MSLGVPTVVWVLGLLVGLSIVGLGVLLLVLGRRRGPDGGAGSAMLAFGITALMIGAGVATPCLVMLVMDGTRTV